MDVKEANPLLKKVCFAFTEHPRLTGETYVQHLCFALKTASKLLLSGIALVLHGFFPFLFMHTASETIQSCHGVLHERRCKTAKTPE